MALPPLPGEGGLGVRCQDQDFNNDNTQWLNAYYDNAQPRADQGTQFSAIDVYTIENLTPGKFTLLQRLYANTGNDFVIGGARFSNDGNYIAAAGTGDNGGLWVYVKATDNTFGKMATENLGNVTAKNSIKWSDNDHYLLAEDKVYRMDAGTVTGTATGAIFATSTATGALATDIINEIIDLTPGGGGEPGDITNVIAGDWAFGTSTDDRAKFLIIGGSTSNTETLEMYTRSVDSITQLANAVADPPSNDAGTWPTVTAITVSPDQNFVGIGVQTTNTGAATGNLPSSSNPQVLLYRLDKISQTLVQVDAPAGQPVIDNGQGPLDIKWSSDSEYMCVSYLREGNSANRDYSAVGHTLYRRDGDTLVQIATPQTGVDDFSDADGSTMSFTK